MIPRSLCFLLLLAATSSSAQAPRAMPLAHDPSSIIRDGGLYYVFVTGPGIPFLSSPDAQTWTRRGSVFAALPSAIVDLAPGNDGVEAWAPDIIKLDQTFYLYYAVSHWNSFASVIALATNTTLDPADPAYHWQDRGPIVRSNGTEDLNAIDPGVILAPDSTLWLSFGSYHGPVDLIQLDPKTGLRIRQDSPTFIIARDSEASDSIAHDGFVYLCVCEGCLLHLAAQALSGVDVAPFRADHRWVRRSQGQAAHQADHPGAIRIPRLGHWRSQNAVPVNTLEGLLEGEAGAERRRRTGTLRLLDYASESSAHPGRSSLGQSERCSGPPPGAPVAGTSSVRVVLASCGRRRNSHRAPRLRT